MRLLAAEDNPTNQNVLRELLKIVSITPTIVNNGAEALAAWRDGQWDLVLMDIQMPVMDGVTAVKAIRALEEAQGRTRTPIYAVTANAMDHQVSLYMHAGMDGHIAKPIAVRDLFDLLSRVKPDSLKPSLAA